MIHRKLLSGSWKSWKRWKKFLLSGACEFLRYQNPRIFYRKHLPRKKRSFGTL
jgi:hypothetical protein